MCKIGQKEGINVICGSGTKLPFQKELFDVLLMIEVLQYIPKSKLKDSFNEIKRVLKPEGRILFTLPNSRFLFRRGLKDKPTHKSHDIDEIENLLSKLFSYYKVSFLFSLPPTLSPKCIITAGL